MSRTLAPEPTARVEPLAEPPSFSVVIRAYQAAATIGKALDSAIAQTHLAQQIVVVDDGSTDDLDGALAPYRDRIELVRRRHGGGAAAFNAGAEAASGEFMAILDADDAYHPRRLEAIAELARARPDLDLITTDARFLAAEGERGRFSDITPFAIDDQRRAILRSCFAGGWPAVRISRIEEAGGFDESLQIGHDWDCWLRLILAGSAAGLVAEPLYDYRLGPEGLTSRRVDSLWDRVALLEKAERNPHLREEERPVLRDSLRHHRSRAVLAEAHAALYADGPGDRLLHHARSRGVEAPARALAVLSRVAPPLARRLLPKG